MNLTVECNKHSIGLSAKTVIDENGKDVTIKVEECPTCNEEAVIKGRKEEMNIENMIAHEKDWKEVIPRRSHAVNK